MCSCVSQLRLLRRYENSSGPVTGSTRSAQILTVGVSTKESGLLGKEVDSRAGLGKEAWNLLLYSEAWRGFRQKGNVSELRSCVEGVLAGPTWDSLNIRVMIITDYNLSDKTGTLELHTYGRMSPTECRRDDGIRKSRISS